MGKRQPKFFWVRPEGKTWNDRKKITTTALESGASGILLPEKDVEKAAKLGDINIVAGGDKPSALAKKGARTFLVGPGGDVDDPVPERFEHRGVLLDELRLEGRLVRREHRHEERPLAGLRVDVGDGVHVVLVAEDVPRRRVDVHQPVLQAREGQAKLGQEAPCFVDVLPVLRPVGRVHRRSGRPGADGLRI